MITMSASAMIAMSGMIGLLSPVPAAFAFDFVPVVELLVVAALLVPEPVRRTLDPLLVPDSSLSVSSPVLVPERRAPDPPLVGVVGVVFFLSVKVTYCTGELPAASFAPTVKVTGAELV